ncbi:MAG: gliding motility-associated C-terminal domain-containing protein [Chitinophagaceae bacterium]|nr:gliding motility-associated C-terminal domain-containing protein [Chitinophagaceae bacterium]
MRILILLSLLFPFSCYSQVNLSQGLVAHWDFSGNANDVSGNNNNGIVNGATLSAGQAGIPNTAYSFNGSSWIQVPNSASLNFQNSVYSIYALVRPQGFYGGTCHGNDIIDKGDADFINGWYTLRFSDAYSSTFTNCSSPLNVTQQNFYPQQNNLTFSGSGYTPYIVPNTWYCVIAVADGSTLKLYVNGILVSTQVINGPMGTNVHDLFIGRKNSSTYPYWFTGDMDEIRMYDRELNIQEINTLCGCLPSLSTSPLLLSPDTSICNTATIQLNTDPNIDTNSIFWWSPTTGLSDSTSLNPTATVSSNATYVFNVLHKGCNLIDNGDFESGNTAFSSSYIYAANNTIEGEYFVGPNPQAWNGGLGVFGDHTTGTGNMLIVNGAPLANTSIWCKTVNVTPNTDYSFSAWLQNVNIWGATSNPPILQFSINSNLLGTPFNVTPTAGLWQQFFQTWNSGANTTATICIINQNTIASGNDFAIDDIEFAPFITQSDTINITLQTPPTILAGPDTSVCNGSQVQLIASGGTAYSWSPATYLNNTNISNPLSTPLAGTTYTVTGTDQSGCSNTATVSISTLPAPLIGATASPSTVCAGSPTTLTGSGGNSYSWSGGVVNGIAFVPQTSTTYTVTGTDASGCSNTSTVTVSVIQNLNLTVAPSAPLLCLGDSVQMTANGANTYSWSPSQGLSSSSGATVWGYPQYTTTYIVQGIDANGCSGSVAVTITVIDEVNLNVTKSGDAECKQNQVELQVSGAAQYVWSPVSLLSNPNGATTMATVDSTTTFYVTGIVGSCTANDSIIVYSYNNDANSIFIPTAFSPNGDGKNDCFRILHRANFKSYYLGIYNRYGELVFETDQADACWDGNFKNKEAELSTYYYYLKAETTCGKIFRKGDITLVR